MSESISTTCVQGGYRPGDGEPRQIPIYQSTTWKYDTSEHMGRLFDLEEAGYFYTRLANPTNDFVAAKIAELEGGTAAMLTSSGQAANFFAVFNIAGAGDHVVASSAIYGGTYNLLAVTMKRMGLECTFVSPDCTDEELEAAFRPNTKAVFGETVANPALSVFGSALVGLVPNCAASIVIAQLYVEGVLGSGAMLAGLLVSAGVGLLVLVRTNRHLKENIAIIVALYAMGVIWGLLANALGIVF